MGETGRDNVVPLEEKSRFLRESIFFPLVEGKPLNQAIDELFELWSLDDEGWEKRKVLEQINEVDKDQAINKLYDLLLQIRKEYPTVVASLNRQTEIKQILKLYDFRKLAADFTENISKELDDRELSLIFVRLQLSPFILNRFLNPTNKEKVKAYLKGHSRLGDNEKKSFIFSVCIQELDQGLFVVHDDDYFDDFIELLSLFEALPVQKNGNFYNPFFSGIDLDLVDPDLEDEFQVLMDDDSTYSQQLEAFYGSKKDEWPSITVNI